MIIEVVGKEIEKIKGDFESYLNGLNMVGEISYSQYSELYDEGTKQIQKAYELGKSELEKENAELKELLDCNNCSELSEEECEVCAEYSHFKCKRKEQLTKTKEIIKYLCGMVRELNKPNVQLTNVDYSLSEAEQLIKDSEVEK